MNAFLSDLLICIVKIVVFFVAALMVLVPVRFLSKIPSFIIRKLFHAAAFSAAVFLIETDDDLYSVVAALFIVALAIFPLLRFLERFKWYRQLLVEKRKGEVVKSMFIFFAMAALLSYVGWGLFDHKYVAVLSILIWGFGDAAAAVVGIPFGKHKIRLPFTDGRRSYEGSIAMFTVASLVSLLYLVLYKEMALGKSLLMVLPALLAATFVELVSDGELDTITVPLAAMAVLLLMAGVLHV